MGLTRPVLFHESPGMKSYSWGLFLWYPDIMYCHFLLVRLGLVEKRKLC